ncbi:TPA: Imm42 family immunity protein [Enterobacter kobei]
MIYGDPVCLSLQFDVADELSTPNDIWKNGLFSLCIEGCVIFNAVAIQGRKESLPYKR